MEKRPWPIILLAFFHLTEPLVKLLFYSWYWNVPITRFFHYMMSGKDVVETFIFLFAFPIAGIAIFAVKNWSLPVFFGVQAITVVNHVYDAIHTPHVFPPWLMGIFSALNFLVVTYFLLPAVRLAYTDASVRWWEARPRFYVSWSGLVRQGGKDTPINIGNIAEGGIFGVVRPPVDIDPALPVQVSFVVEDQHFSLLGRIRHQFVDEGNVRFGVQFWEVTNDDQKRLKKVVTDLAKAKTPRKPEYDHPLMELGVWFWKLVRTGKGLVPELDTRFATRKPTDKGPAKKNGKAA